MGVVFAMVTIVCVADLIEAWPSPVTDQAATIGPEKVNLFGVKLTLHADQRLFVVVACALEAMIHVLRSFTWYVGNRSFVRSWLAQRGHAVLFTCRDSS